MTEYIVRMPSDMPYEIKAELNAWYVNSEPIVRCRDCKWFTPECEYQEELEYGVFETIVEPPDCGNPERCSHHYDSASKKTVPVHIVTQPDGFCAWGKRRDA